MFNVGDVVRFHSPTAGKEKFHLCLGCTDQGNLFAFLHLNSKGGFRGDYALDDGQIPGLPKSQTGQTIVSFSAIVRMGSERLVKFRAVKTGEIDGRLAGELAAYAKTVRVLTGAERALVAQSLESMF